MNQLLIFATSLGFGSFAWLLLALSDWLLGDKPPRRAPNQLPMPASARPRILKIFRKNSPRSIVPGARRAS
ncbi:MAG TPA: hypothetical protein VGM76_16255 [Lacipirellulaceae bacterium]